MYKLLLPIMFHFSLCLSLFNFMISVFPVLIKISQPTLLMTDLHSFYIHVLVKVSVNKLIIIYVDVNALRIPSSFFLSKITVAYDVKCSSAALSRETKRKIFYF